MWSKKQHKTFLNQIIPITQQIAENTMRGYIFGSIFGVFTPKSSFYSAHNTGKTFARMAAIYSSTELILEKINPKNTIINSIICGSIAGGCSTNNYKLLSAMIFGSYSGVYEYFKKNNN